MSDYKHATDRVDGTIIADCIDCDEYNIIVEYETAVDDDVLADFKQIVSETCPHCGGTVGTVKQETPTEVLE